MGGLPFVEGVFMKASTKIILLLGAAITSVQTNAAPANADIVKIEKAIVDGDATALDRELDRLPKAERAIVLRALTIDPRIIGGSPALASDFPWQVALIRGALSEPQRSQFCGGTLIANDLIITAAHCVDNAIVRSDPARLNIIAGVSAYETGGQRASVKAIVKHPNWNKETLDYDVAILRLSSPVTVGRPIALANTAPTAGTRAWVSGWGATVEGGRGSSQLMAVEVPVVDQATCNAPESYNGAITPQMFCAGEREGGKDSCQGDSGGPLVTGNLNEEQLIGVVSWGEGCARRLKYGIYTKLSAIGSWLTAITSDVQFSSPPTDKGLFPLKSKSGQIDR
jgi:secreted trypsin-like serine protease